MCHGVDAIAVSAPDRLTRDASKSLIFRDETAVQKQQIACLGRPFGGA
jgi:hypothetical protein